MKTCLIVFAVILAIILVLTTALLVYVFAFEKELPQVAIDQIKQELKGLGDTEININFATVNDFGDISSEYSYKHTQAEEKKILMERTGKDDTFVMTFKQYNSENTLVYDLKFYKEGGKYMGKAGETASELTQSEWEEYVVAYFMEALPLDIKDGKATLAGGKVIEEELKTVKQKGFEITAIAGDEIAHSVTMTYNLRTSIVSTYKYVQYGDPYNTVREYKLNLDLTKIS